MNIDISNVAYSFASIKTSLTDLILKLIIQKKFYSETRLEGKGKVCIRANWPIRPELIPVSVAWILLLNSPPLPIYTPVCIKKVKFLAQEHNTMSPARARTQAARSGVERTKDEATANMTNPERPCFLYETKIYLDVLLTGEQCT